MKDKLITYSGNVRAIVLCGLVGAYVVKVIFDISEEIRERRTDKNASSEPSDRTDDEEETIIYFCY